MAQLPAQIVLDVDEEAELKRWLCRRKTTAELHLRTSIVLN